MWEWEWGVCGGGGGGWSGGGGVCVGGRGRERERGRGGRGGGGRREGGEGGKIVAWSGVFGREEGDGEKCFVETEKTLSVLRLRDSGVSRDRDENMCSGKSCADLALWIIVWLGAETGLVFLDDQSQAIGCVVGYVLTHVDDMCCRRHSNSPVVCSCFDKRM